MEAGMRIATAPVLRSLGPRAHRYGLAPGVVLDLWRASKNVDVCIMQGLWTLPVAAASRICARRQLPYVLRALGTLEAGSLGQKPIKKRLYRWLVASGTVSRAAAVHFASERERDRSRDAIGRTRGVVVPNAFDVRPLVPPQGAALRARLRLPADALLVGMAGRVHPDKGFDTIVPALARADPRVHLLIFGSDHEKKLPRILSLAAASGVGARVHALGPLEPGELDRMYASIDVLALPSHGETFGNVVVEALRQGTPVMISDQVPLAPYVEAQGLGAVVEVGEPEAWASALDRWAAAPLRLQRESTAALIARDFSLDVMAGRWLEILTPIAWRPAQREASRAPGRGSA
jgi:glycosyltransferase involved in cell wall biosynthesis